MSPDSKEARDFIKTAIISNPDEAITKMSPGEYGTLPIKEKDKNGKTIGYGFSSGDEFSYGYMNPLTPLLFLAKEPIFDAGKHTDGILLTYKNAYTEKNLSDRFKWEDVFNIVVDLKVGKVFWKKNKQEDEKEIEGDIEQYRKMLKDRFYFDFSNNE